MEVNFDAGGKSAGGTGFVGLLQILFIALKLCKVIKWSWWWVLAPLWISSGLAIIIVIVLLIVAKKKKKW